MRTKEIIARNVTTRDSLVEHPEGKRRRAYKVCEVGRTRDLVSLRIREGEGFGARTFAPPERVRVLAGGTRA